MYKNGNEKIHEESERKRERGGEEYP